MPSKWTKRSYALPAVAAVCGLFAAGVQAQDSPKKPRKAKPATAVETSMERQIRNAIDAGDGDLLARSLRQKVIAEPANIDARLALAADYQRQGADELAVEHYRVASALGSQVATSRLAQTLDRLGESELAIQVMVLFCDSHPGASSRILSELGILEDEMSNLTAGEHYHRRALAAALEESASAQDALHNNLGYNLTAQKRFSEAEYQLRTALELNPRSEMARNNLALALSSGSTATAAQVNEAILHWQSLSGPAAAHNNLAAVYLEQSRYPEARRELERALHYDASSRAALKNLEALSALDGQSAQISVSIPPALAHTAVKPHKSNFIQRLFARKQQADAKEASVIAQQKSHHRQTQQ